MPQQTNHHHLKQKCLVPPKNNNNNNKPNIKIPQRMLLHQLSLATPTKPPLSNPAETLVEPLTPRESEVLKLICVGQTNGEIADELGIAIGTVKFYTGQIYGKLGVRNRVTAVARARELHLISNE